ncbi:hypothetical protein BJ944DRAFT_230785 [Cunninghamella echinulata]|nr:hypothetical protein BJ944DRAFT_230785 [Cunninghamella echinulata]
MTSNFEKQLFSLYEKIKIFLFEFIHDNRPLNEEQANEYKSLRVEYSEYLDFFETYTWKEKELLGLLGKLMKFTHFVLNIYSEEDLTKFYEFLFKHILDINFIKEDVTNGYIELKTYLWAKQLKHLETKNNNNKIIMIDILSKYFSEKRITSQHLTDEQLNAIQLTEEDFDEDDIPNNQQQLIQKGKGKRKEIIIGNKNKTYTQAGPSSFSKRKVNEIESSDEESSSSDRDSIYNRQMNIDEESDHDPESSNVIRQSRISPSLSSRKKIKQVGGRRRLRNFWTDLEVTALEEGMKEHGPNWPKIKEQYDDILKNRTVGDLKDKAVNVVKKCYSKNVSAGYFENIHMYGGFQYLLKYKYK